MKKHNWQKKIYDYLIVYKKKKKNGVNTFRIFRNIHTSYFISPTRQCIKIAYTLRRDKYA